MSRRALRITLAATVLFALLLPAAAKAVHPAPYRLHQLKGDAFPPLTVLESDFAGDYTRVAYVPAALSEQSAQAVIDTIPVAPQQELTFEHAGKTLKYLAVGDLSKPAKMILVYLHGFGDDRSQGVDEKRFGGNFARLKRLIAENDAIYLSPDFSGFGRQAEDQVAALIADYAGRAPGAPVFVACISYGGSLCWRLAEAAGESSPLRGILVFGAAVDRGFLKRVALNPLHVYVGIGTKDAFASWKSADAFFRDVKTAAPDYPIKLAIFDAGEHAAAIRLTDWVEVLNWMLPADDAVSKPVASSLVGGPPCPRPRPGPDGHSPPSYCGGKP
jgi:pimeloyl-ACP methyl ester carboxylesterase